MKGPIKYFVPAIVLSILVFVPSNTGSQEKIDFNKIVGVWDLVVAVDTEYYLTMELKLVQGELKGTWSEQGGAFTDTPLSEVKFDGTTLSFDVIIPTPPDGIERLVHSVYQLTDGKLEGILSVPDLQVEGSVTGTRRDSKR